MLWILLTLGAVASPVQFYADHSDRLVEIDATGRLGGVPVALGETVLAKVDDVEAIRALPRVADATLGPRGRVTTIRPAPGVDLAELSRALHDRGDVHWAHPDLRFELVRHYLPDDPYLVHQWHLENTGQRDYLVGADIHAAEAWDLQTGAGQLIAIIDTGVDPDHPDLDVIVGYDYVDDDADSTPPGDDPHGTACAGLAAGTGDNGRGTTGVAYEADVYGIRLVGGSTSLNDMYNAFVEAVDAGASVLSNSWGYDQGCADITLYGVMADALDYAENEGRNGKGAAIVFSAGNGNCDITADGMQSHPAVISVAASDGNDNREGYSSFGPWVDITAPSGNIATADIPGPDGYPALDGDEDYTDTFSGTSASAPEISGVLALMFAANERLTAAEAREALCASAVRIDLLGGDWDETGWSPYYGCGRVDAGAAVRMVSNQGGPEVPLPLGPELEVEGPGAVLHWEEPVDPDGDRLAYKVRWWRMDDPKLKENKVDTDRPWVELTEEEAPIGVEIGWKVRAVDPWGPSEWSPERSFTLTRPPKPEPESTGGCASAPTAPAGLGWLLLPLLLWRRRR